MARKIPAELLDELRQIADANGGLLLSTEWKGADAKHLFAYTKEPGSPTFERTPGNLRHGGWPEDIEASQKISAAIKAGKAKSPEEQLAEIRAIAETNGGRLLSTEWLGAMAKYRFAFADGREFWMTPSYLKNPKYGWPKDTGAYLKTDQDYLAEIGAIAKAHGGKLLSTEWNGARTPHRFAFEDGCEFEMTPGTLKNQGWPSGLGVSQERCHLAMEFIFGTKFARNVRSIVEGGLELDGWNESLRVAFEYQGDPSHHEKEQEEGFTYVSRRDPVDTQKKDAAKAKWCCDNGVVLVVIDDLWGIGKSKKKVGWESQAVLRHVMEAVEEAFNARGMAPPQLPDGAERFSAVVPRYDLRKLQELREIAEANGGRLLSTVWLGSQTKYRFVFADGREFEMRPTDLKNKKYGWPRDQDAYFKMSAASKEGQEKSPQELLAEIRTIAEANRGKLLSTEWLGNKVPHRFAFEDGREFERTPSVLKQYGWPKDPDAYFKKVERFVAREIAAGSSLSRAAAKPAAVAPDIRAAHSDAFLPSGRGKPASSVTAIPNLAELVANFQGNQPAKRKIG